MEYQLPILWRNGSDVQVVTTIRVLVSLYIYLW